MAGGTANHGSGRTSNTRGLLQVGTVALGAVVGAIISIYPGYARYHQDDCRRDASDDTIVMAGSEDVNPLRKRHNLIQAWNDRHPRGPRARLVELPGGADQEQSEMLAAMQSRSCAYDVLSLDVVWIPGFIGAGYLQPLNDLRVFPSMPRFAPGAFQPLPWRTGTGANGDPYAIPFHSDVGLLYYRKKIVPRPPRTWDELRSMARRLTGRLPDKDAVGLATQLANYEGLTVNGMEAVWAARGTLRRENGKIVVDEAAKRGLGALVADTRSSLPKLENLTNFQETDTVKAFIAGKALFMRNWPYAYPVLSDDPLTRGEFGVAELPGPTPDSGPGASALGGQGLAIPVHARNKRWAREFIRFLTEPEQQQYLFACSGYVPVRVEAYRNIKPCSELQHRSHPEVSDPLSREQLRELAALLERALDNARTRPDVPYYPGFSRAFHGLLHDWITGGRDPRPFLADRLTACSGLSPPPPAIEACP
jgi:multiple sugar transport system substrate-binding protein